MKDRGMIKWAPYKSLVDQSSALAKMRYRKNKIDKPSISSDAAEEINEILTNYSGEKLRAKYWEDGYIYYVEGVIVKIDTLEKVLTLGDKKIPFKVLLGLTKKY